MDAVQHEKPFVVMLASRHPYRQKLPFLAEDSINVINPDETSIEFVEENSQLKNLAVFMLDKADKKNKILYATDTGVLFALYYVAQNPTHFDALILENSKFHLCEFTSFITFFRDIPTLKKCEQISKDIPILFGTEYENDQMIHAALRIAGKNAHFLIGGRKWDDFATIYSLVNKKRKSHPLNEKAVKAFLERKEKERIHRYKEYAWLTGSACLFSFCLIKTVF